MTTTNRGRYSTYSAKKPTRDTFRTSRVLAIVGVTLALAIPVILTARDKGGTGTALDSAIERVTPSANDLDLRQAEVSIDLANDYQFVDLTIDNTIIPDDQLTNVAALNQHRFRPGEDQVITEFTPGRHCATARFKPLNANDFAIRGYTWCFNLH